MYISKILSVFRKIRLVLYPKWNRFKFKLKGVEFGCGLKVYTKMYIGVGERSLIQIGNNFTFSSSDCINPLSRNIYGCIVTYPDARIIIGNNVGMSSPCLWARKEIIIGNNVNIGGDCILMDSDAHSLNYIDRRDSIKDQLNRKDGAIRIEDDVLIGTRCIILKGVTIGARSVIGGGSIVTKSIPSDCVAAGNPCKVIKYLNEE